MSPDEVSHKPALTGAVSTSADGIRLTVRLTPKASRNAISGPLELPSGDSALKISITAPPESGKANAALIKVLAKAFRVPKSAIAIVQGAADRNKLLTISGPAKTLMSTLARLENDQ